MHILLFVLSFIFFLEVGFADTTDEKIYFYANGNSSPPFGDHYDYLFKVEEEDRAKLKESPNSSSAWGSLYLVYMGLMYTRAIEVGSDSDALVVEYEKKMVDAESHLFGNNNSNELIDPEYYHFIVGGLSDKQKIIAYNRMLKTPYYGETDDIRTGDYFQYSNAYFRLGEYDKAIEVLNQMLAEKEAGNSRLNVTREYIQSRIQEAENKKLEVAQANLQDQYTQVEAIAEPYTVVEQVPQAESYTVSAKVEKQKSAPEKEELNLMGLFAAGGVALLILLGWFLRRRKE